MAINLNHLVEIPDPYKYDGCYTVVKKLSEIYSREYDSICNKLDERDLNALLFMCIGTWKLSTEKKEENISNSNLSDEGKNEILSVISDVENKANNKYFLHSEGGGLEKTWGLFGTGTFTVKSVMADSTCKDAAKNFVLMIKQMLSSDGKDSSLFKIADDFAQHKYGGLQTGLVSQFLHCLFPFIFPILNSWGRKVFSKLEVDLKDPEKLSNYIENCKIIKDFRDTKTNVKNYRVFDIMFSKPTLYQIIKEYLKDHDINDKWQKAYETFIPNYIDEAKQGINWKDWDTSIFDKFMAQDNGVSFLPNYSNFSSNDTKNIESHWDEIAPHLAKIAKHQDPNDEPDFKEYNTLGEIIGKYTSRNLISATCRLIAALQPRYLCTIVSRKDLNNLYNFIQKFTCEQITFTRSDIYKDSNSILKLFQESMPNDIGIGVATLPWRLKEYFEELNEKENSYMDKINNYMKILERNYNMILTGAPGTGKTYLARQIATSLIGCKDDELDSSDQFEFVQFHPSYDYSDFVEGLRPVKGDGNNSNNFDRKDGIFLKFCENALNSGSNTFASVYNSLIGDIRKSEEDDVPYTVTLRNGEQSQPLIVTENDNIKWVKPSVNTVSKSRLYKLFQKFPTLKQFDGIKNISTEIRDVIGGCDTSYYWAILKDILSRLKDTPSDKKYVFVIDEINRGELSKIFGELFFSIDPGYRGKKGAVLTKFANLRDQPNSFDLALDKKEYGHFFVPDNVYIIGTMNDIDRSVESMDFAMRRRFAWVEIKADENIGMLDTLKGSVTEEIISEIKVRMHNLNAAILNIPELGKEYQIGAAYFLKYPDYDDFNELWEKHLQGLLYEYLRGSRNATKELAKLKNAYDNTTIKQESGSEDTTQNQDDYQD